MSNDNYKLYRKNKTELFELVYEMIKGMPVKPYFGFSTQDEEEEYNKKCDEYLESIKPEIKKRLKEMGFFNKNEVTFNG